MANDGDGEKPELCGASVGEDLVWGSYRYLCQQLWLYGGVAVEENKWAHYGDGAWQQRREGQRSTQLPGRRTYGCCRSCAPATPI